MTSSKQKSEQTIKKNSIDSYILAYIRTKWNPNQFSIPAAILGPFYLLYRKMITQAFILIIIYITIHIYLPENLGIFLRLSFNIITACFFNRFYYQRTIRQIGIIKNYNKESDSKELLEICKKMGGTLSFKIIIATIILYLTIIAIILLDNHIKPETSNKQTTIKNNDLIIQIPPTAIIKSNHDNYQHIVDNKCYLTITRTKTNLTSQEYLTNNKQYYLDYSQEEIQEKTINNITWNNIYMKNDNTMHIIYVTKRNNNIYELNFRYTKEKECDEDINLILNNIKTN